MKEVYYYVNNTAKHRTFNLGGGYDDAPYNNCRGYAGSYAIQYDDKTSLNGLIVHVLYCTKDYIYLLSRFNNVYGISRQIGVDKSWILPYSDIGYMCNQVYCDSDEALVICDLMPESWLLALNLNPRSSILQIPLNQ